MIPKPTKNPVANYCFTYNNYTEDGEKALQSWATEFTKYTIYGHEIAPTTGTPHLQGFFSLKKKARITTLQKKFRELNIGIALIVSRGSASENFAYCTKVDPNGYWCCGDIRICGQGSRSDRVEIAEHIKEGKSLQEVYELHRDSFIQYHSGIKAALFIEEKRIAPKLRDDLCVTVLWGDAGTGKTHTAYKICTALGFEPFFVNSPQGGLVWFDGYDREECMIIDDFKGWIKPHDLFRIMDKYPYRLPYKGGYRYAFYRHLFITSNYHPRDWYNHDVVFERQALFRRIKNLHCYLWHEGDGRNPETDVHIIEEENQMPYDI